MSSSSKSGGARAQGQRTPQSKRVIGIHWIGVIVLLCFNITIKNNPGVPFIAYCLLLIAYCLLLIAYCSNGVHAHGVKEAVREIPDRIHDKHRPKIGIVDGVELATGRNDLIQRHKHV